MPRVHVISTLVLVLSLFALASKAGVEFDLNGGEIADRGLVLSGATYSRDEVRRIAREFLQNDAKGATIARLVIAKDKFSLNQNYAHGSPHNNYRETVAVINRSGFPKGPMARMLSIGGRGKISYVENGELTEEILSGASDPTALHDGRYSYELLHFMLSAPGPGLVRKEFNVRMFFKASPAVSSASCVSLFQMIRRLINVDQLIVHVRPDPWFFEEQQYPAVLSFTRPLEIPTQLHYMIAPAITCGDNDGRITCSGTNYSP